MTRRSRTRVATKLSTDVTFLGRIAIAEDVLGCGAASAGGRGAPWCR